MISKRELLHGPATFIVLDSLSEGALSGPEVLCRIGRRSDCLLEKEGGLYVLLYLLESRLLIRGKWSPRGARPRRRMYRLTRRGRRHLERQRQHWDRIQADVDRLRGVTCDAAERSGSMRCETPPVGIAGEVVLPAVAVEYLHIVRGRLGLPTQRRHQVHRELSDHFADLLADYSSATDRQARAELLIVRFGEPRQLGRDLLHASRRRRSWLTRIVLNGARGAAILVLVLVVYLGWLAMGGRPKVRVDSLAVLNEQARPAIRQRDDAWPLYQRANSLYVEPESVPDANGITPLGGNRYWDPGLDPEVLTDRERVALEKWVADNEAAWKEFAAASEKPYNWRTYALEERAPEGTYRSRQMLAAQAATAQMLINLDLDDIEHLRMLAKAGIARSHQQRRQGHLAQSIDTVMCVARAAAHFQNPHLTVLDQMRGVAQAGVAQEEILRIVQAGQVPAEAIAGIQARLQDVYDSEYPTLGIEADRLAIHDAVQWIFTEGELGGGHFALGLGWDSDDMPQSVDDLVMRAGISSVHAGRSRTLRAADAIYDYFGCMARQTPYESHVQGLSEIKIIEMFPKYQFWTLHTLISSIEGAIHLCWTAKAGHDAALAILALHRHRLAQGQLPQTLQALQPDYLEELPRDPFSDGLLQYKRRGEDFVLYSVGRDFTDDGGLRAEIMYNPLDESTHGSDDVFWPLEPLARPSPPKTEESGGLVTHADESVSE